MKSLSLYKRTLIPLERKTKFYKKKTKPNLNQSSKKSTTGKEDCPPNQFQEKAWCPGFLLRARCF